MNDMLVSYIQSIGVKSKVNIILPFIDIQYIFPQHSTICASK
jgi:hypothetical protein